MEARFRREMDSLAGVFEAAQRFCADRTIADGDRFAVELMLEEVFTNLIKYGSDEPDEILISLETIGDSIVITVTDFDSEEFDLQSVSDVDVSRPLSERTPGGLGLHLLKKLTDEMKYDYDGRRSTITLTRRKHD